VKAGANLNIAAEGGVTPLHAAAENGSLDCVQVLIQVLLNTATDGNHNRC
jgi:ankyrin repeat protein